MQRQKVTRPNSTYADDAVEEGGGTLLALTDDVLEDIDEALEENALEVLRKYVAKGGE